MQSKFIYVTGAAVAALSVITFALQRKFLVYGFYQVKLGIPRYLFKRVSLPAYYVDQCSRDDPEVNTCLMHSANRLARLLQVGIPELGMEEVNFLTFVNLS